MGVLGRTPLIRRVPHSCVVLRRMLSANRGRPFALAVRLDHHFAAFARQRERGHMSCGKQKELECTPWKYSLKAVEGPVGGRGSGPSFQALAHRPRGPVGSASIRHSHATKPSPTGLSDNLFSSKPRMHSQLSYLKVARLASERWFFNAAS